MTANDDSAQDEETDRVDSRSQGLSRRSLIGLGLFGLGAGAAAMSFNGGLTERPPDTEPTAEPTMNPPTTDPAPTDTRPDSDLEEELSAHPFLFAEPGNVQSLIDKAGEQPQSRVRLLPGRVYETTKTWRIRRGVTLDYNGAIVEHQRDVDLHDIQPGACIERPVIDLRGVRGGFSSSVFKFDSRRHGFYGNHPSWYVRGGITRGKLGQGTLYEFVQGNEQPIYFVHADHAVRNIGTVVDMHRGDAFGINGNRIYGLWYGFEVGIHMHNRSRPGRSIDNISGNHFDVIAQPEESRILWDLEAGHYNVLRGRLWDFKNYSDVMWRIHGDGAEDRIGNILYWMPIGGTIERLREKVGPRVFDDKLGEDQNRVVVPWRLGSPVSQFTDG